LEIDSSNIKIAFNENCILTTQKDIVSETFNNNLSIGTIGVHSIDEFNGNAYFLIDGEFEPSTSIEEINNRGTRFTFALLRVVQNYVFNLWKLKDNNIYIRDGFLYVYEENIADGATFKASLSAITSFSDISAKMSKFSTSELKQFEEIINKISLKELFSDPFDYKISTHDHFFKYSKSERFDRAWYFILNARAANTLPMKIVSYCTALECIFTTGRSELIHRIAERVAIMTEVDVEKRVKVYNIVKKAYDVRSTVVHGALLKGENDHLKEISIEVDKILRNLFNRNDELFFKNDAEIDSYFISELLKNK
jgi:hypothetical protein